MVYRRRWGGDAGGPDAAQRSVLLWMACSLAFDRFVQIYRKYSEDQPRDERGRWVDAGGEREPETTGSLRPVYNERTGNPKIDGVTDGLNEVLSEARRRDDGRDPRLLTARIEAHRGTAARAGAAPPGSTRLPALAREPIPLRTASSPATARPAASTHQPGRSPRLGSSTVSR